LTVQALNGETFELGRSSTRQISDPAITFRTAPATPTVHHFRLVNAAKRYDAYKKK